MRLTLDLNFHVSWPTQKKTKTSILSIRKQNRNCHYRYESVGNSLVVSSSMDQLAVNVMEIAGDLIVEVHLKLRKTYLNYDNKKKR